MESIATKGKFAIKLKELREQVGFSQTQLANELGISRGSISHYENGERQPDVDVLVRLCKYFNVSADYLIGLSDVASLDTDMQAVCDYIGLDDVGVGIIENAATKKKNVLLMINNGKVKKIMETEGVIEWQV